MSVSFLQSLRLKHSIHDAHQEHLYWISNHEINQFLKQKQHTATTQQQLSINNNSQRSKAVSSWSAFGGDFIEGLSSTAACIASVTFKIVDGKKSRGGAKSGRISLALGTEEVHLRWKTITQRTFSTKSHVTGYHCGRTAAVELNDGSLLVISHENAKDKIGLHDGKAAVDDRHPPFLFSSGDTNGAYLTIRLYSSSPFLTLSLLDLITHVDSLHLSIHSVNGNVMIKCSDNATVKDERHLSKRQRMRLLAKSNQSSIKNDDSNKKKPNKYAKVEEEERSSSNDDDDEIERKQRLMESSINETKRSIDSESSSNTENNEVDDLESFGSDEDESDDESSAFDFDNNINTNNDDNLSMNISSVSGTSFSVRGIKRRQFSEANFFDEKKIDTNEGDDKMWIPIEDPPITMPAINSFIDNLPPAFTSFDLPSMSMPSLFPVGSPLPFSSFSSHDDNIPLLLPPIDYDRSIPFSFPHSPSLPPTLHLMRNFSLNDTS